MCCYLDNGKIRVIPLMWKDFKQKEAERSLTSFFSSSIPSSCSASCPYKCTGRNTSFFGPLHAREQTLKAFKTHEGLTNLILLKGWKPLRCKGPTSNSAEGLGDCKHWLTVACCCWLLLCSTVLCCWADSLHPCCKWLNGTQEHKEAPIGLQVNQM